MDRPTFISVTSSGEAGEALHLEVIIRELFEYIDFPV